MSGDIADIKRRLADQAPTVAAFLLPNGKRDGQEWRAGSIGGESGKSLGVHLAGEKAGVWTDFNGGDGGDLVDLWAAVRRVPLATAVREAREWLGISRPEPKRTSEQKTYIRPAKPESRKPEGQVFSYLTETRNLSPEVLEAYQIGEAGNRMIFPFLLPGGTLAMAKAREAVDGVHPVPTAKDCEPVLFGWQAIPDEAREVVITEGEIDALSSWDYGFPALSVPYGGGAGAKQQWIESDFERMDRFERIYIATDMDGPGDEAAEEISARLGRHRCYRVRLPRKDMNGCLVDGILGAEIQQAIRGAESLDPEGLKPPSAFEADVIRLFYPQDEQPVGYRTPYSKLGMNLLFRPGEMTVWSGDSGQGKSQVVSDCIVAWISQGSRICWSSLEMRASQSLRRGVKQVIGVANPTQSAITEALQWMDGGLLLYDRLGKAGVDGLLEVFDYARAKYGCDQFVIDSLMRLGVGVDDYAGQEQTVYRLVSWSIENNVHTHLVAHSKKGNRDRRGAPETEDIKGAMEIGANAFNIITVWRNRALEENLRTEQDEEKLAELRQKPTVVLNVTKQRNGDFERPVGLWFDQETYQYRSAYESMWSRRCYLPKEGAAAA